MTLALQIAPQVGVAAACEALGVPRATLYRRRSPKVRAPRPRSPRALSTDEQQAILAVLHESRFVDASPAEVHATLLDEGVHLCSVRTMYRLLHAQGELRERRAQRQHPNYKKAELVARGPNQLWSWDITKVQGDQARVWFHLYVVLDVFSRKVVGWMLASTESASLAEHLLAQTMAREGVQPGQLTLHADRGSAMRSKTVAELLDDLGVTKSHSRPRVSDDNPFSEAQFKTMKYCPFFPGNFNSIEDGRAFFRLFFPWYNEEHHHSGIAMFTPQQVHTGQLEAVLVARQAALDAAYQAHPERFVHGPPRAQRPPAEVWINRPTQQLELTGSVGDPTDPAAAQNLSVQPRPCPDGPPAQGSEASAEGGDGLDEASRQVHSDTSQRI